MTDTLQKKPSNQSPDVSSEPVREEAYQDFIGLLRQMPSYDQLPMQRCTLMFPAVSAETCRIAEEAFMQFVEKYGLSLDDVGAISKALAIVWSGMISKTCGEVQLTHDELISNVKWQ